MEGRVMKSDNCPECLADLRCCRGCRFFDPTAHRHCREPVDSFVSNKEKANFCDWFQVRLAVQSKGQIVRDADSKESRKKRFNDLFND
jgi:hypothetical protein